MSEKRFYKFLDDHHEWVVRDRTNRRNEYRIGRNKKYAERIVDLLNQMFEKIEQLSEENEHLRKQLQREKQLNDACMKGQKNLKKEKKF